MSHKDLRASKDLYFLFFFKDYITADCKEASQTKTIKAGI